ncbi:MAG: sugar phosphate isomerase/epimerase [Verrucomicrobia bacterium]|nr:MAG: sugar phosphate isomerase/epimerase [Verrucomicrobiota bacterium]
MARAVTLFTGQWADIPLAELLPRVKQMGYDGVELACWGDHFDVQAALTQPGYIEGRWELLKKHDLACYAISAHLVGQAVCDLIDERHQCILPAHVWGDGEAEGVRQRAALELADTARACRKFLDAGKSYMASKPAGSGKAVVNGFTGSSIWGALYAFPPTSQAYLQKGYDDFAKRFGPILDVFEKEDVYFALEVHPTEIAFDIVSAQRALDAVKNHKRFGFNYDPSHLGYQGVDYVKFIRQFSAQIHHAHMKDVWWGHGDGSVGVFGGHTDFCDARRFWDFRSVGRGDIRFEDVIVALNDIGYTGPLSVEWEDGRMDRFHGATESCAYVRKLDFPVNQVAFDAAFDKSNQ